MDSKKLLKKTKFILCSLIIICFSPLIPKELAFITNQESNMLDVIDLTIQEKIKEIEEKNNKRFKKIEEDNKKLKDMFISYLTDSHIFEIFNNCNYDMINFITSNQSSFDIYLI